MTTEPTGGTVEVATQEFPYPHDLKAAVDELRKLAGLVAVMADEPVEAPADRGCAEMTAAEFQEWRTKYK